MSIVPIFLSLMLNEYFIPFAAAKSGFSITDYITDCGYPVEVHKDIETEDGYLLETHRIPYGKNNSHETMKPVVFLMHGICESSIIWILAGPNKALPFLLADKGYDVWLGNTRGNRYSKKHKFLKPESSQFWDFSWHEIGYYDLPANFRYIYSVTNQSELQYVGYSQGGTTFLVMATLRPNITQSVSLMVGLAPASFTHTKIIPKAIATYLFQFINNFVIDMLGLKEFGSTLRNFFCEWSTAEFCRNFILLLCGILSLNFAHTDQDVVDKIVEIFPDSCSMRQLMHFGQIFVTGEFIQYDYGPALNLQKYGSVEPPAYDVSKVTTPTAIIYSESDSLVPVKGARKLIRSLPNVTFAYEISALNDFTHADFTFSRDVVKHVYSKVLAIMSDYWPHLT